MPLIDKNKVYGIDLGTTYSAIAYVNDYNQAEIITNSDNERVTPSVIFFESPQNIIVGTTAKDSANTDADRVVDFVKRQIGTDWAFEFEGINYKPEELSSYILRRLVEDAKKTGDHDVRDVVITCPAYFGDAERNATRLAGELAGLNVLQILDEPAAAALNYGLNNRGTRKNAIIYDLGGGTFDVSVVSIDQSEVKIVCTDGDHRLGGKNWDDAIVGFLVAEFQAQTGVDNILDDSETSYSLRSEAERAKRALTNREKHSVRVSHGGERVNVELTRERFEELTRDLLDRTIEFTRRTLELARSKGVDVVDEFLLVGGSTRMPMIAKRVTEEFATELGCEPQAFEVDEAVAKGAALFGQVQNIKVWLDQAATEFGEGKTFDDLTESERERIVDKVSVDAGLSQDYLLESAEVSISTVATKSYGIRVKKNGTPLVYNLIERQTPTPVVGEQVFRTEDADAELIEIRVFSNNIAQIDASLDESVEIGVVELELPPGLPARTPVRVSFNLSSEGKLEIFAVEESTGRNVKATFAAEVGMNDKEIQEAKERSRDLTVE